MIADTADTMELPKRKRNADDGELDVTPMIDVTFLLLAFFVVVSKMDPQASVPLPSASYGVAISDKECVTLIMAFGEFEKNSEDDRKEFIGDYVEKEYTNNPSKNAVLIKAAGNCKTGVVEMVKKGVGKSGLAKSEDRKIYVGIEEEQ